MDFQRHFDIISSILAKEIKRILGIMKGDTKSMKKSKILSVIAATILVFSTFTVAFADTNYSSWDSYNAYPQDVMNTTYFTPVKALIDKKIVTGYPDGTFKPENLITRAEIAVAVTKMTNRTNLVEAAKSTNKFTDVSGKNYDWARGYINVLADAEIIKGKTQTTFAPSENISYIQLMTILIRTKSGAASELEQYGKWPNNYIEYIQRNNLLGDVVVKDWNSPATRGDMAKLMYRMMPKSSS